MKLLQLAILDEWDEGSRQVVGLGQALAAALSELAPGTPLPGVMPEPEPQPRPAWETAFDGLEEEEQQQLEDQLTLASEGDLEDALAARTAPAEEPRP